MNNNISNGKWKQIRGQTKVWWGKLTHNNNKKVSGKLDQLVGRFQEKIGNSQQRANENYEKRTK
ncbi:MAG: CsbD family protein [Anaerolineaceae bacterium]|nr:CsbD family protein [Anaerolineaceae bacterium]